MGLPRIQVLPSDVQYYSQEVTSPLIFFSTFETVVNTETDHNAYDIIPMEELDVGMVTEVTTTSADPEDVEHRAMIPIAVECELTGSENETETCDLENQTYSGDDGSYTADIFSEVVSSSLRADVEQNHENIVSSSDGCNVSLDINSENLNELVADVCGDDLVFAWLSGLDENTTINTADFETLVLPDADRCGGSDACLAKDELRSFLLSRKMKSNVVLEPVEEFEVPRNRRSGHEDITGTRKRTKFVDCDPEETRRHLRRQERNRVAARKCRQKRTKLAEELTNESEQLRKDNDQLTSEVRDLTRELRKLENYVLDHDLHMGSYQCHESMSALLLSQHLHELL